MHGKNTPNANTTRRANDPDVVIVGAGLSGAVLAQEHASIGHRVLLLEKRSHIGGNCYDYTDPVTGIRVSRYGAHLFHTNKDHVWSYVNRFSNWTRWDHKVLAWVKDSNGRYTHVPVPVNINTVNKLVPCANIRDEQEMLAWLNAHQVKSNQTHPKNSEEMARSRVGNMLYDAIFGPYTQKQWNMSAALLGPEVTARIPVRANFDDRYFDDRYVHQSASHAISTTATR
jgi:UDP-galactopyranose mutase